MSRVFDCIVGSWLMLLLVRCWMLTKWQSKLSDKQRNLLQETDKHTHTQILKQNLRTPLHFTHTIKHIAKRKRKKEKEEGERERQITNDKDT